MIKGTFLVFLSIFALFLIAFIPEASASSCPSTMFGGNTEENPCLITSCEELQAVNDDLAGNYALADHIECSATKLGGSIWDSYGFEPLGRPSWTGEISFTGSFEGNFYEIRNLFINRTEEVNVALFGALGEYYCQTEETCAKLQNLHLVDVEIYGGQHVSSLFADSSSAMTNVSSSGYVECFFSGCAAGGLGHNNDPVPTNFYNGFITNVYSTVDVVSNGGPTGGLIARSDGPIENCYSTGDLVSKQAILEHSAIGGLIGNSDGDIKKCYSSSNTQGGYYAGGIAGVTGWPIWDSFAIGYVDYVGTGFWGGLVGRNGNGITNTFFHLIPGGPTECFGFDFREDSDCTVVGSFDYFQDKQNNPLDSWDFDKTWVEQTGYGQLPRLKWEFQEPLVVEIPVAGKSIISLNQGWNLISFNFTDETARDKEIQIDQGWNLIGYSGQGELNLEESVVYFNTGGQLNWSEAVFQNKIVSRMFYLDSDLGHYRFVPDHDSSLRTGKGYWMHAIEPGYIRFLESAGPETNKTVNLLDVKVRNSTDEVSLFVAQNLGWLEDSFWYYEDNQFKEASAGIFAENSEVEAWRGYFIKSNIGDIALIVEAN